MTRYPQSPETLDVVFISTALAEARELLVKWKAGLTATESDLGTIEAIEEGCNQ